MRQVILSGGIYHPFADCAQWMAERATGEPAFTSIDVAAAIEALEPGDLFTLYALRWRMLNDPKYQPYLNEWAFSMPPELAQKLEQFVHAGGSMLAMHTASICFDTWPEFSRLLGGHWQWGQTFHPPISLIAVEPIGQHPLLDGVAAFELEDEVYHNLEIEPDSEPLLRARTKDGDWQTVAWVHSFGDGQVIYNALGHDVDSLQQPMHARFLDNAFNWLCLAAH